MMMVKSQEERGIMDNMAIVKRCCEMHSAYCVTGVPNNLRHRAPMQRNTCTLGKVTD
jgi:hypothetical protein